MSRAPPSSGAIGPTTAFRALSVLLRTRFRLSDRGRCLQGRGRFFHNVAREMGQTMTDDMKELGFTREDYFRSLLDARYRQLIAKQVLVAAKNGPGKRG